MTRSSLTTIIFRSKHYGHSGGLVFKRDDEMQKGTVAASPRPKTSVSLSEFIQITKIAIVGTGHVDASKAFALAFQGLCDEVVPIDSDQRPTSVAVS